MRIGHIEFTPKRIFGAAPALILAGAMWIYYCAALLLEFSSRWRYSEVALGQTHIWTAAFATLALMILCGVFWKRAQFTRGTYAIGCFLGAILAGLTGLYIEQEFFHAAWNPEKSKAMLILGGNVVLLLIALVTTPLVLSITKEHSSNDRNQTAEQDVDPNV